MASKKSGLYRWTLDLHSLSKHTMYFGHFLDRESMIRCEDMAGSIFPALECVILLEEIIALMQGGHVKMVRFCFNKQNLWDVRTPALMGA